MKLMMGSLETSRNDPQPNEPDLHGSVFVYQTEPDNLADEHEVATRSNIAKNLAALKGFRFRASTKRPPAMSGLSISYPTTH